MTLLESYRTLDAACGQRVNILIEPTVRRYSFEAGPTVSYRVHLWQDRGTSLAVRFCEESHDLETLTHRAIEAHDTWSAGALAQLSSELTEVAA